MFWVLVSEVNPFLMVDKTTRRLLVYPNLEEAYYDVILKLFLTFPRGYIDLPLFMTEYMAASLSDAESLCLSSDVFFFPIYDPDEPQRTDRLRLILTILLQYNGVTINNSAYLAALSAFDVECVKQNIKSRIENGSIIQFCKEYYEDKREQITSRY